MSRLYWLVLSIAILAAFAFCLKWFGIAATNDVKNDKINVELTVDKGRVKEDAATATSKAQELGRKTKEEVREVAKKIENLTEKHGIHLELDTKTVELEQGAKIEVGVTRSDGELNLLQLGLIPSSGSDLLVSGGLFNVGESVCRITIEAPKGARSGSIRIVADNSSELLTVTVKP